VLKRIVGRGVEPVATWRTQLLAATDRARDTIVCDHHVYSGTMITDAFNEIAGSFHFVFLPSSSRPLGQLSVVTCIAKC
jgi:hypothetical protein